MNPSASCFPHSSFWKSLNVDDWRNTAEPNPVHLRANYTNIRPVNYREDKHEGLRLNPVGITDTQTQSAAGYLNKQQASNNRPN